MPTQSTSSASVAAAGRRDSWVPMIAIALGQVLMSFNVASLPVALSGMVNSFSVPPTTVATGIVTYSLMVAGFVMLGAKLNQRFGALYVFRTVVVTEHLENGREVTDLVFHRLGSGDVTSQEETDA